MANISYYSNAKTVKPSEVVTVDNWLTDVAKGRWRPEAERIAAEPDKKKRQALKVEILGGVTASGTFATRGNDQLIEHSGFIVMDFDDLGDAVTVAEKKALLAADPYSYAVARSVSGLGLFAFVQIDGAKHQEAYDALKIYYLETYGLIVDKACRDVARFRFNSYDPDLDLNQRAKPFKSYLTKAVKAAYTVPTYIATESSTAEIVDRIVASGVDLTQGDYSRYLRIGFALADQYGEAGLEYFHRIAQANEKYDPANAEKQFNYCLKGNRKQNNGGVGIGTLYHFAKQAGVDITNKTTQIVATVAQQTKAAGRGMDSARTELALRGISGDEVDEVLKQVDQSAAGLKVSDNLTLFGRLELFLQFNYRLERNSVTRKIELNGRPIEDSDVNDMYIQATKTVDEKVGRTHVEALLYSSFVETYDPLIKFFENNRGKSSTGHIKALCAAVTTGTGKRNAAALDPDFFEFFFSKWLVGIVASAHGHHSPLLLALTGGQNTGKTEFFRRLLPKELSQYYAESKLDAGKDDEILMTQKLLVCDDEMGGKSKRDETRLKELTSKATFTLREPYGRQNVDLRRLAVLCGTSNQSDLLNDPTGNRRVIPVDVQAIDHAAYNAVDKTALLMEAYHLWKGGFGHHLDKADIKRLAAQSADFEGVISERELLLQHFSRPEAAGTGFVEYLTTTEIQVLLEKDIKFKINTKQLGAQLQALGFVRRGVRIGNAVRNRYGVVKLLGAPAPIYGAPEADEEEPLPF